METIHFKTVDPVSQELLRDASRTDTAANMQHDFHNPSPRFHNFNYVEIVRKRNASEVM